MRRLTLGATALAWVMSGGPAMATPPAEVADLVGVKGRDGEAELQTRGYVFHHGAETKDGKMTVFWNAAKQQCLQVLTQDGRYASIMAAPATDCEGDPE